MLQVLIDLLKKQRNFLTKRQANNERRTGAEGFQGLIRVRSNKLWQWMTKLCVGVFGNIVSFSLDS